MDGRRFGVLVGAAALVAPLTGWTPMPAAATGAPGPALSAVPASVCFPSQDNGDPVLTAFDFSPRQVDSRGGAVTMTFTVTAEDTGGPGAATGVVKATAFVYYDDSNPGNWTLSTPLSPDGHGALAGTLTIGREFRSGTRWVSASVEDAAGNTTFYTWDDLARMGLPSTFTATTAPDEAAPAVRSVHLSSAIVDTRRHRAGVTVRVRATDDNGVTGVGAMLYGWPARSPHADLRLVSGTATDGVWQGRLTVRRWQGNQTAKLHLEVTDLVSKYRSYGAKKLATMGQPSRLRIVSRTDPEAPTIRLRSVTPDVVDVRSGEQRVTVTVRVRDRYSGARRVAVSVDGPQRYSGGSGATGRLVRVSGTAFDGIWRATLTLRRCDHVAGDWAVTVFAWDAAGGNYVAQEAALAVTNGDVSRPTASVAGDYDRVRREGPLTVEFDEDVAGVTADNALVHVGDSRRGLGGDDPAPVPGSWSCRDGSGAGVDCSVGPVRTAAFTPAAPMLAGTNHTLVLNPEHHLGLTDLVGNPYDPGGALRFHTA